jgi:REP element-mobilizing transposase RayT
MPRKPRIEYPGAMYHVMSRGDRQERIFLDDVDRQDFIKTLAEACQKTNWQVHAYCLMPNHYHLVLETPEPNLVRGMAWLQSTYTIRLNHRHRLFGHVLSGRYKSQLVEGSGNGYLRRACDYVHLNPVRAGMLRAQERLLSYPWSSFGAYLASPEHRPSWIRVDRLLGEHGLGEDTPVSREGFDRRMERRRTQETDPDIYEPLGGGGVLAARAFGRRCRSERRAAWAGVTPGNCTGRLLRPRPRGSLLKSWSGGAGAKLICWAGARETRRRWPLLHGCDARPPSRSRPSPPDYALELPNRPTAGCTSL